jgi:hypothetical protein
MTTKYLARYENTNVENVVFIVKELSYRDNEKNQQNVLQNRSAV